MTFPGPLIAKAEALLDAYRRAGLKIATAESCTGGLIAGCLTEIPGASDVVERGFLTYSNEAKHDLLGVPMALINCASSSAPFLKKLSAPDRVVITATNESFELSSTYTIHVKK
ncbi:MAG: CinA family protein [Proteobacteria bacterium]|nr:CinA family protein [Pseudomonadota bacterium]